jgi:hypothetical protein
VPAGAVSAYVSAWGVTRITEANTNTAKYGMDHKKIIIMDNDAPLYTSLAEVTAWLASAPGGGAAAPVALPVALDLAADWGGLLTAIQAGGKYVALDLAASTISGTTFNPDNTNTTGKNRIVSLVLPSAATGIAAGASGNYTFQYFTVLKEVGGDHIQTIGDYAFYNCTALTTAGFPAAQTIGTFAFGGCQALTTVSLPAAQTIGSFAFGGCNALTTADFPAAQTIGASAFSVCSALTAVSLPASLTTIEDNPFPSCRNLSSITVDPGNPNYKAEAGKLLNKAGTSLIAWPAASGAVTLPGITAVGKDAFLGCTLTAASLPDAVSIGNLAFYACNALATVSLPAATSIGTWAFQGCTALATVYLPAAAPALGIELFYNMTAPQTVAVKVPVGATGYGTLPVTCAGVDGTQNWGNAFRGMGWDGTNYLAGTVNANITVTIEEYTP